jgi:DNA-binding CsgD family transcriptional regulator
MSASKQINTNVAVSPDTYPYEERFAPAEDEQLLALLALSHTPAEHRLYLTMIRAATARQSLTIDLSIRHLMILSGLQDYSAIRRARAGLEKKLSLECHRMVSAEGQATIYYTLRLPEEIFRRRRAAGLPPYPQAVESKGEKKTILSLALARALRRRNLSRRECQVAMQCAEGCTNAEIGTRLGISEDTVKFHLRHVFAKLGLRRRVELIACLLSDEVALIVTS